MQRLTNLRVRLVLWTVALEALLLLVLASVLTLVLQQLQHQEIANTLRLSASQLNAVTDVRGDQYIIEAADLASLRAEGVLAWVLTPAGVVAQTVGDAQNL